MVMGTARAYHAILIFSIGFSWYKIGLWSPRCERIAIATNVRIEMRMMDVLGEHAACAGVAPLVGFVRYDNWPMLTLLARLGFEFLNSEEPQVIRVAKPLDARGLAA